MAGVRGAECRWCATVKRRGINGAVLLAGAVALACGAVVWEISRSRPTPEQIQREQERMRSAMMEAMSPRPVELKGERLAAFLARPPLTVGQKVPLITGEDVRGTRYALPGSVGRPSAWVVDAVERLPGPGIGCMMHLRRRQRDRIRTFAVLASTSQTLVRQYVSSLNHEGVTPLVDHDGRILERLRPPGPTPTRLPTIWAADAAGVLRFVYQPASTESPEELARMIERALDLPPPAADRRKPRLRESM
jgi:hypothetical protein